MTLNYQELRNCLYRGNLNDAAKELCNENNDFLAMLKQKKPHQRYLDVEFIIRYFAISDNIKKKDDIFFVDGYKGKLVAFLNEYMDNNKDCSIDEKEQYKKRFNETIEKIKIVFGVDKAFRDISTENVKVYKTIADFIMPSFERMSFEYVNTNKREIYNKLILFLQRDDIQKSLLVKTSDKDMVNLRIGEWFKENMDGISF